MNDRALDPPASAITPGAARGWRGDWRDGVTYGAMGLPLAFVALPLYVVLPSHYATRFGVPLAALGFVLLGARLLDALADPLIGRLADRLFARSATRAAGAVAAGAALLALGFQALFFPVVAGTTALLAWCAACLAVTYAGYSLVSVIHQAWGARLGGGEAQRTGIVAWREGLALAGVLIASVLPSLAGLAATSLVLALSLIAALALLWRAPRPQPSARSATPAPMLLPFRNPEFVRLLSVYLANGIASAVPATLVLFFIRDRLQATSFEPLFLGAYFLAAALSIPLWVRAVKRFGLGRSWLAGMALAIIVFGWAALLREGDVAAYLVVCVASGVALGADLTLPGAMLAGVIQRAGHSGHAEGAYFGWWNFATKLNLALAAGLALPVLEVVGYAPGSRDPQALDRLSAAYCLLPCVLKLAALALLWATIVRPAKVPL